MDDEEVEEEPADFENDIELLDWAEQLSLNFDKYIADWLSIGATGLSDVRETFQMKDKYANYIRRKPTSKPNSPEKADTTTPKSPEKIKKSSENILDETSLPSKKSSKSNVATLQWDDLFPSNKQSTTSLQKSSLRPSQTASSINSSKLQSSESFVGTLI
jgi:hypothetical protein